MGMEGQAAKVIEMMVVSEASSMMVTVRAVIVTAVIMAVIMAIILLGHL